MITTVIERDDLSNGVRVSTIRCEESGAEWYETLAYIPHPYFCGEDPEVSETIGEALNAHHRRCNRALGVDFMMFHDVRIMGD